MTSDIQQEYRVKQWNAINGERLLRLKHDLTPNSIVFDVGGYKGETTADFLKLYDCEVYIFEPVKEFVEIIRQKFQDNPKVHIFDFGLSNRSTTEEISLEDNAASIYKHDGQTEKISLVKISDFMRENAIERVDLMDINIEGSEYDLIEDLITSGEIAKVENVQVQFHWFVENAEERMRKLQNQLRASHFLTYQHSYIWENWKRYDKKNFFEEHLTDTIMSYSAIIALDVNSQIKLDELQKLYKNLEENVRNYDSLVKSYEGKLGSRSHKLATKLQRTFAKLKNLLG